MACYVPLYFDGIQIKQPFMQPVQLIFSGVPPDLAGFQFSYNHLKLMKNKLYWCFSNLIYAQSNATGKGDIASCELQLMVCLVVLFSRWKIIISV